MKKAFILFFIFSFFVPHHLLGQSLPVPQTAFDSVFVLIYNQKFQEAAQKLEKSGLKTGTLYYNVLYLDLYWWKSIKAIKDEDFTEFGVRLKNLTTIQSENETENKLSELIRLSYLIRMSAHENHFFTIFRNLSRTNELVRLLDKEKLTKAESELFEIYKAIINVLKSKLFLNSELQKTALSTLEKYINSDYIISRTASVYFTGKIYVELENKPPKALPYFEKLTRMYPEHKIFKQYVVLCSGKK